MATLTVSQYRKKLSDLRKSERVKEAAFQRERKVALRQRKIKTALAKGVTLSGGKVIDLQTGAEKDITYKDIDLIGKRGTISKNTIATSRTEQVNGRSVTPIYFREGGRTYKGRLLDTTQEKSTQLRYTPLGSIESVKEAKAGMTKLREPTITSKLETVAKRKKDIRELFTPAEKLKTRTGLDLETIPFKYTIKKGKKSKSEKIAEKVDYDINKLISKLKKSEQETLQKSKKDKTYDPIPKLALTSIGLIGVKGTKSIIDLSKGAFKLAETLPKIDRYIYNSVKNSLSKVNVTKKELMSTELKGFKELDKYVGDKFLKYYPTAKILSQKAASKVKKATKSDESGLKLFKNVSEDVLAEYVPKGATYVAKNPATAASAVALELAFIESPRIISSGIKQLKKGKYFIDSLNPAKPYIVKELEAGEEIIKGKGFKQFEVIYKGEKLTRKGKTYGIRRVEKFNPFKVSTYMDKVLGKKPGSIKYFDQIGDNLLLRNVESQFATPLQELSIIKRGKNTKQIVASTSPDVSFLRNNRYAVIPGGGQELTTLKGRAGTGGTELSQFFAPETIAEVRAGSRTFKKGTPQVYIKYSGVFDSPEFSDLLSGKAKFKFFKPKAGIVIQQETVKPISKQLLSKSYEEIAQDLAYFKPGSFQLSASTLKNVRAEAEVVKTPFTGTNVKELQNLVFPGGESLKFYSGVDIKLNKKQYINALKANVMFLESRINNVKNIIKSKPIYDELGNIIIKREQQTIIKLNDIINSKSKKINLNKLNTNLKQIEADTITYNKLIKRLKKSDINYLKKSGIIESELSKPVYSVSDLLKSAKLPLLSPSSKKKSIKKSTKSVSKVSKPSTVLSNYIKSSTLKASSSSKYISSRVIGSRAKSKSSSRISASSIKPISSIISRSSIKNYKFIDNKSKIFKTPLPKPKSKKLIKLKKTAKKPINLLYTRTLTRSKGQKPKLYSKTLTQYSGVELR